jgi:hypothetical protein
LIFGQGSCRKRRGEFDSDQRKKKPYRKPEVHVYGDVLALTAGQPMGATQDAGVPKAKTG